MRRKKKTTKSDSDARRRERGLQVVKVWLDAETHAKLKKLAEAYEGNMTMATMVAIRSMPEPKQEAGTTTKPREAPRADGWKGWD